MPNDVLFFIVVYSILIACSTFLILTWYLLSLQKETFLKEFIDKYSQNTDFFTLMKDESEEEVAEQVDSRLNDIVAGFKKQIPMISMFLSRSKEAELKETARVELMKLIPLINQHFSRKVGNGFADGEQSRKIGQFVDRMWKQVKYRLFLVAVLMGLVLGFIEAGLWMILFL